MPQGASRAAAARDDVGPDELRAMEGELHRFLHDLTDGNAAHAANIMTTALRYIPTISAWEAPARYESGFNEHLLFAMSAGCSKNASLLPAPFLSIVAESPVSAVKFPIVP